MATSGRRKGRPWVRWQREKVGAATVHRERMWRVGLGLTFLLVFSQMGRMGQKNLMVTCLAAAHGLLTAKK